MADVNMLLVCVVALCTILGNEMQSGGMRGRRGRVVLGIAAGAAHRTCVDQNVNATARQSPKRSNEHRAFDMYINDVGNAAFGGTKEKGQEKRLVPFIRKSRSGSSCVDIKVPKSLNPLDGHAAVLTIAQDARDKADVKTPPTVTGRSTAIADWQLYQVPSVVWAAWKGKGSWGGMMFKIAAVTVGLLGRSSARPSSLLLPALLLQTLGGVLATKCQDAIPALPAATTRIDSTVCNEGTLPTGTGNLANVNVIDLSGQMFNPSKLSGTLPTEYGSLVKVTLMNFQHAAHLTGTLPTELGKLIKLTEIISQYASLSGTLPTELGGLQNLEVIVLGAPASGQDASISGTLPSFLSRLGALEVFIAQDTKISGPLPSTGFSNLTTCWLPMKPNPREYDSLRIDSFININTCELEESSSNLKCSNDQGNEYRCCQDGGPDSPGPDSGGSKCAFGTDSKICGDRIQCPPGSEGWTLPPTNLRKCSGLPASTTEVTGVCVQCPPGRFKGSPPGRFEGINATRNHQASQCVPCARGTWAGGGATKCTDCLVGKYNPLEQSSSSEACVPCLPGKRGINTQAQTSEDHCTDCDGGKYSKEAGLSACTSCASGNYAGSGQPLCLPCTPGKKLMPDQTRCMDCPDGSWSGVSALECTSCKPGFYGRTDKTTCIACAAGKYSETAKATGDDTCIPCGVGKYSSAQGASAAAQCNACAVGTYSDQVARTNATDCIKCKEGSANPSSGQTEVTACNPCATGRYQATKGAASCDACDAGKYSETAKATGDDTCIPCEVGKYSSAQGASAETQCNACAAGTYSDQIGQNGVGSCKSCDAGYVSQQGNSTCSACEGGKTSSEGSPTCAACQAGKKQDGVKCIACDEGQLSGTGSTECTDCDAGRFGQSDKTACEACGAGTYSAAKKATSNATCISCGTGKYSSAQGASAETQCNACAAGKFGDLSVPHSSTAHCVACTPGYFSNQSAATECIKCSKAGTTSVAPFVDCASSCVAGQYGDKAGGCVHCPAGRYLPGRGATDITQCYGCPTGRHSSTTGAADLSACANCPPGHYVGMIAWSKPCEKCAVGQYQDLEGKGACKEYKCAAGKFGNVKGTSARGWAQEPQCEPCGAGRYADQAGSGNAVSRCEFCPGGRWSNTTGQFNEGSCVDCVLGRWGLYGSPCTPCSMGRYGAKAGQQQESQGCAALPAGYFSSVSGLVDYKMKDYQCPAGKFGAGNQQTDESGCNACSTGKYQGDRGTSECTSCGVGRYADQTGTTECNECPKGRYSSTNGTSTCVPCTAAAGQFQDEAGESVCKTCPVIPLTTASPKNDPTRCAPNWSIIAPLLATFFCIAGVTAFFAARELRYRRKWVVIKAGGRCFGRWSLPFPRHTMFRPRVIGSDGTVLGHGAFGEVLRGTLRVGNLRHDIAIKQVLQFKATEAQMREVMIECRLQTALNHPFILKCYGFCDKSRNRPFSVLLLLLNIGDLPKYMESEFEAGRVVAQATRLQWIIQIASALEYMHACMVLHCDLAARNLCLLRSHGGDQRIICQLTDFGLSRFCTSKEGFAEVVDGTQLPMWWMAPECLPYDKNFVPLPRAAEKRRAEADKKLKALKKQAREEAKAKLDPLNAHHKSIDWDRDRTKAWLEAQEDLPKDALDAILSAEPSGLSLASFGRGDTLQRLLGVGAFEKDRWEAFVGKSGIDPARLGNALSEFSADDMLDLFEDYEGGGREDPEWFDDQQLTAEREAFEELKAYTEHAEQGTKARAAQMQPQVKSVLLRVPTLQDEAYIRQKKEIELKRGEMEGRVAEPRRKLRLTKANDVWAFGVVIWEVEQLAVTGKLVVPLADQIGEGRTLVDAIIHDRKRPQFTTHAQRSLVDIHAIVQEECWRSRAPLRHGMGAVRKSIQRIKLADIQLWSGTELANWLRSFGVAREKTSEFKMLGVLENYDLKSEERKARPPTATIAERLHEFRSVPADAYDGPPHQHPPGAWSEWSERLEDVSSWLVPDEKELASQVHCEVEGARRLVEFRGSKEWPTHDAVGKVENFTWMLAAQNTKNKELLVRGEDNLATYQAKAAERFYANSVDKGTDAPPRDDNGTGESKGAAPREGAASATASPERRSTTFEHYSFLRPGRPDTEGASRHLLDGGPVGDIELGLHSTGEKGVDDMSWQTNSMFAGRRPRVVPVDQGESKDDVQSSLDGEGVTL